MTAEPGPRLRGLTVADPPGAWERLGFLVVDARIELGGVELTLGASGRGITGWAIAGLDGPVDIDGLRAEPGRPGPDCDPAPPHPNRAIGIDHVVVLTPAFDRTARALESAGLELRRVTDSLRGVRQGFRRLGPTILELVEAPQVERARLWGVAVVVEDIEELARRLGDDLGPIKPAVQPGRRIATLSPSAGLTAPVAFMDPATAH